MRLIAKTNTKKKKIVNIPIQGGGAFRIEGVGAAWARAMDGHKTTSTAVIPYISPDNRFLIAFIDIRIRVMN